MDFLNILKIKTNNLRRKVVENELASLELEKEGQGIQVQSAKPRTKFQFLTSDPKELFERLQLLISARKEGHSNKDMFNEINAILKELLNNKFITLEQYKQICKI